MIGYAVGEVIQSDEEVQEEGEGQGGVARWHPEGKEKCYEVVTTWVHPSYRGLNMSVQMYLMIIRQGEDKLTWHRKQGGKGAVAPLDFYFGKQIWSVLV